MAMMIAALVGVIGGLGVTFSAAYRAGFVMGGGTCTDCWDTGEPYPTARSCLTCGMPADSGDVRLLAPIPPGALTVASALSTAARADSRPRRPDAALGRGRR